MGTSDGLFQAGGGDLLVAFDFDGTLTWRDSFLAFLLWRAGPARFALGLAKLIPASLAYAIHRDRGRLKVAATRVFLGGTTLDDLRSSAAAFAESAEAGLMRPDALRCWNEWRTRGARLVIVTASPEIVVAPFARRLGADALIGTRLATDDAGRVTGAFDGANCRGPEKVSRLREMFGPGVTLAAAYGDTAGDREMLSIAGKAGYRVFNERP
jgi:phosphatidylglycerophosphatase C